MNSYVQPSTSTNRFSCPHCGAFSLQFWSAVAIVDLVSNGTPVTHIDVQAQDLLGDPEQDQQDLILHAEMINSRELFARTSLSRSSKMLHNLHVSSCFACEAWSIWKNDQLLYPVVSRVVQPHEKMPSDVALDFEEAAKILPISPRGAAALLRLAVQKLCGELGGKGKRIDEDIKRLVEMGLPRQVQQAMDVVRVIGNEAVHPGQIDLRDDVSTAQSLFELLNIIVEQMIAQPARVEHMFSRLPIDKREAIQKRDSASITAPQTNPPPAPTPP